MHFPIIVVLGIALLSCVRAAAPPRAIEVFYPAGGANLGQNVTIGYQYTDDATYRMNRNESISLMLPNGTTNLLLWTEDGDPSKGGSCFTYPGGGASATLPVLQVGT